MAVTTATSVVLVRTALLFVVDEAAWPEDLRLTVDSRRHGQAPPYPSC